MAKLFVLDCSVTMSWCFADEATPFSREVLRDLQTASAIVPSLWVLEVNNVLLGAEKKKRISRAQSSRFLLDLANLPIQVDELSLSLSSSHSILEIARDFDLTIYDATYLELSVRSGAPIATLDRAMKAAAKKIGLKIYE